MIGKSKVRNVVEVEIRVEVRIEKEIERTPIDIISNILILIYSY